MLVCHRLDLPLPPFRRNGRLRFCLPKNIDFVISPDLHILSIHFGNIVTFNRNTLTSEIPCYTVHSFILQTDKICPCQKKWNVPLFGFSHSASNRINKGTYISAFSFLKDSEFLTNCQNKPLRRIFYNCNCYQFENLLHFCVIESNNDLTKFDVINTSHKKL